MDNNCQSSYLACQCPEAGIRILKDIVFQRIKAYNLVQIFEFITVTFEMYYERILLSVAYNRMDRYISLHYKGQGAYQVNNTDITKHDRNNLLYLVKSNHSDREYIIDTENWNKFVPIQTSLPSAPEHLLNVIRCNCHTDCSTLCKRHNIECTPACSNCR